MGCSSSNKKKSKNMQEGEEGRTEEEEEHLQESTAPASAVTVNGIARARAGRPHLPRTACWGVKKRKEATMHCPEDGFVPMEETAIPGMGSLPTEEEAGLVVGEASTGEEEEDGGGDEVALLGR
ncbi:MAG: hypothetical protein FRX49_11464 [Trebouxia sp. A1-2]|nr:MAG: hypothetical protein FRX49_11464 [Trebouxia sp. A1-2]